MGTAAVDWDQEGVWGDDGTRSYGFDASTAYNAQVGDSDWQDYSVGAQPPVQYQANEASLLMTPILQRSTYDIISVLLLY